MTIWLFFSVSHSFLCRLKATYPELKDEVNKNSRSQQGSQVYQRHGNIPSGSGGQGDQLCKNCHQQLEFERAHLKGTTYRGLKLIKELQSTSVSPDKIPGLIPFKKIAPKKTKVKHVTQVHGSMRSQEILSKVQVMKA